MRPYEPKQYQYISVFAIEIEKFVQLKRALGCKYDSESGVLRRLDRYCATNLKQSLLTRDFIGGWITQHDGEMYRTRLARYCVIKAFIEFLNLNGIRAELPASVACSASDKTFIPYVFTKEQIQMILSAADNMPHQKHGSMFHAIFPAVLRVLYGCGLRISEALALKRPDVNLHDGILIIRNAKNGDCRQTPMSETLRVYLKTYCTKMGEKITQTGFFFPNVKGEQYSHRTVYDKFRTILWQCGISHTGKGPRVHDFRHTFAVHTLNNWSQNGRDCYVALPVLAVYLGHKNVNCTERYLRLTAEVFPEVLEQTQAISDAAIPVMIEGNA